MTPEQREYLRYYLMFDEANGQAILDDLTRCYELHQDDDINEQNTEVDHPYRAYLILGQQMVVRHLKDMLAAAKMPENQPEPVTNAEELDNENTDDQ